MMADAVDYRGSGKTQTSLEETPLLPGNTSRPPEKKYSSAEEAFDEALSRVPVGAFHLVLIAVCGWAIASDSVEIQCISFVTPQLDSSNYNQTGGRYVLRLDKSQEGVLDAIIFLGMMVGGYMWGSLSDMIGRRSCLITSLTFNGVFGLASAFSPSYAVFLLFRFLSGVGVGGSFPVVFSYFSEFFSRKSRGPFVIVLAAFWILGSVFAALMAWIVIGQFHDSAHGSVGAMTMESWRIYVIICTFPCLSSALSLIFLPESPSFLFAKGKLQSTAKVMQRIQLLHSYCGRAKEVMGREGWSQYLRGLQRQYGGRKERREGKWAWLAELFESTVAVFHRQYLRAMVVMLIVWFMFSFG
jgi:VNT family MFS transporter (synaptic vesicle glycoprotein 2)